MRKSFLIAALLLGSPVWAATYYVDYSKGNDAQQGTSRPPPGSSAETNAADGPSRRPRAGRRGAVQGRRTHRGSVEIPIGKEGSPITYRGDGWGAGKAVLDGSWPPTGRDALPPRSCEGTGTTTRSTGPRPRRGMTSAPAPTRTATSSIQARIRRPSDPFHYDRTTSCGSCRPRAAGPCRRTRPSRIPVISLRPIPHTTTAHTSSSGTSRTSRGIYKITGFDPTTHTIDHEKIGGAGVYKDRDTYYAIINHPAFLSGPGQYYHDEKAGRLYVWPRRAPARRRMSTASQPAGRA